MKVSYNWLKDYVDLTVPPAELAQKLTGRGVVVEGVEEKNPGVHGVVVGRIGSMAKHPNADALWVCQVDVGDGILQIVTGAQNVHQGDLVPVAVPGSRIPGKELGVTTLRGVESHGMLCSPEELGIDEGGEGILILPADPEVTPGADAADVLGLNDWVLELDLTANYAAHCQSMVGVAQETASLTGSDVYWPEANLQGDAGDEVHKLMAVRIDAPDLCARYAARIIQGVTVGPSPAWLQARVRAAGMRPINNIVDVTNFVMLELGQPLHAFDYEKVGGSQIIVRRAGDGERIMTLDKQERILDPDVLVIADAQAPVALAGVMGGYESEVTERTTTILLESAVFDNINNRRTARGMNLPSEAATRFTKGVDPSGVLRAMDRAAALIAAVGGGQVVPGHIDVYPRPAVPKVIPMRVARVNAHIGLSLTDEQMAEHLERLAIRVLRPADLTQDLISGGPDAEETGEDLSGRPVWTAIHQVSPVPADPEAYSGWAQAAWAEIERAGEILTEWGDEVGELLIAVVSTRRHDIYGEIDLVEEVARSEGYDRIPATLPKGPTVRGGRSRRQELMLAGRRALSGAGLNEVMTYSLIHPKVYDKLGLEDEHPLRNYLKVANPMYDERSSLRTTLLPGLLDVLQYNVNRGNRDLMIFELSSVYHPVVGEVLPQEPLMLGIAIIGQQQERAWNRQSAAADFYTLKGTIAHLLEMLNVTDWSVVPGSHSFLHPGRQANLVLNGQEIGWIGELHPRTSGEWDLPGRVYAAEIGFDPLVAAAAALRPYRPVTRFPAVTRDVSFVIAAGVPASAIAATIRTAGGDLVEAVSLFDLYQGERIGHGARSLAYSITYRSPERTLTDSEVDAVHAQVRKELSKLGAELRS